MTETQTKWERLVPKRVEQVLDAFRKLTRTGAKDYEPIPQEHADEMVEIVQKAMDEFLEAYAPYTTAPRPPAAPAAEPPKPTLETPDDPVKIAWFVNRIPKDHLPAWAAHLAVRVTDEFYETFKETKR